MIRQRILVPNCNADELQVISSALDAIRLKNYDEAAHILIARHDLLTKNPGIKDYDPREEQQCLS